MQVENTVAALQHLAEGSLKENLAILLNNAHRDGENVIVLLPFRGEFDLLAASSVGSQLLEVTEEIESSATELPKKFRVEHPECFPK